MAELADIIKSAQEFIMLAEQQLRDDELLEAENTARAVIAIAPRYAPAWRALGDVLSAVPGKRAEAAQAYSRALEYDPSDQNSIIARDALSDRETSAPTNADKGPGIPQLAALGDKDKYIAAARSSEAAERWKEAKEYWEYVLKIDPSDTWVWSQYGHLLSVHLHDYQASETAFRRAIEEDPTDDWAWGKLGIMLADFLGKVPEGQEYLREAIRLDPTEPYYHGWLGWSLYRQSENFVEAEKALKEATRLLPGYQWAFFHLGYVQYAIGGKVKEAKASFERALKLDDTDTASMFYLAALYDEQLDAKSKAIQLLERLVEIERDHSPARYKLALHFEESEKTFDKAAGHYKAIIENDPKDITARRYLGALYHEKIGNYQEAAKNYKHALQFAPDDSDLNYRLGVLLGSDLKRWDEAVEYLKNATEISPDIELGWAKLGEAYTSLGKLGAARKSFEKALELEPEFYWAHKELGYLLSDHMSEYDLAFKHFETAIEIEPEDIWCRIAIGNIHHHQFKQYAEAETIYKAVLEIEPEEIAAVAELSVLYLSMYRYNEAFEYASRLRIAYPDVGFAHSLYACCLRYIGGAPDEVKQLFRSGLDLSQTHWNWHEYGEFLLYDEGNMEDAEEAILSSLKHDHDCSTVYSDLALIRYVQGREAEARQLCEKTLELEPDSAEAWRLYGRFLWLTGEDVTTAEQSLEKATMLAPDSFEGWMMLAEFLKVQVDRDAEATEAEVKALELAPVGLDYKKWARQQANPYILKYRKTGN
ncbi:tetratricopeptide repeat protein [Kordiimonas laminariae]|uniref:tetratricopeptide repeat protein n=1 Tax=Kordiimonas laminariae TaxID=2917717 RepID=UPI001FF6322E|nr:tetratricopeptide repeat protein [Kordiimonas laminariae]MCK0068498.1 tetratricopeptide repeat protein [Kordiimonas laminariae]